MGGSLSTKFSTRSVPEETIEYNEKTSCLCHDVKIIIFVLGITEICTNNVSYLSRARASLEENG